MRFRFSFLVGLCFGTGAVVSGCVSQDPAPANATSIVAAPGEGPADARPGACYGKDVTPAVVEVVTEQILLKPAEFAPDGAVIRPAVYRTDTRQAIVKERQTYFFEVPCADVLTPDFIASLQRALKARGFYTGPITGALDRRTRAAIRRFQLPGGHNTDTLTMQTARRLGLVTYLRAE